MFAFPKAESEQERLVDGAERGSDLVRGTARDGRGAALDQLVEMVKGRAVA